MPMYKPTSWGGVVGDIFASVVDVQVPNTPTLSHEVDMVLGHARHLPSKLSIKDQAALIEAREYINQALEEAA